MSISEILIVLLVAVLVLDLKDMKLIFSKIKQLKQFINDVKRQFINVIEDAQDNKQMDMKDTEEINFFLSKIIEAEGEYKGEYSLDILKKKYNDITNKRLSKIKKTKIIKQKE